MTKRPWTNLTGAGTNTLPAKVLRMRYGNTGLTREKIVHRVGMVYGRDSEARTALAVDALVADGRLRHVGGKDIARYAPKGYQLHPKLRRRKGAA